MRKITMAACGAFEAQRPLTMGNTHTDGLALYLHGNKIAQHTSEGLEIDSCQWNSLTTRERLNGLKGVRVTTKQGQMFLNGKKWNGDRVNVAQFNAQNND